MICYFSIGNIWFLNEKSSFYRFYYFEARKLSYFKQYSKKKRNPLPARLVKSLMPMTANAAPGFLGEGSCALFGSRSQFFNWAFTRSTIMSY